MTYKVDIKLYKNRSTGNAVAGDCVRVVYQNVKCRLKYC